MAEEENGKDENLKIKIGEEESAAEAETSFVKKQDFLNGNGFRFLSQNVKMRYKL